MGPNTRTTDWSLADDDFDIAMGPATTHEIENGAGDVQLDDSGRAAEMATGKAFEETRGAKMESTRERQVKVLRSYPLVFAVCSCPAAPVSVPRSCRCSTLGSSLAAYVVLWGLRW